jgi:hypothetical protein
MKLTQNQEHTIVVMFSLSPRATLGQGKLSRIRLVTAGAVDPTALSL